MSQHGPDGEAPMVEQAAVDIRHLSVKCGNCDTYQTLSGFARGEDHNTYTYLCENDICDPEVTKTLVDVPIDLDVFAHRDPQWQGGARHTGGESSDGEDGVLQVVEYDPFADDEASDPTVARIGPESL